MGKNSRRRRVDKQRRADRRRRDELSSKGRRPPADQLEGEPVEEPADRHGERLVDTEPPAGSEVEELLGLLLRNRVWTRGWQPDELVRHARRQATATSSDVELLIVAIAADAMRHDRVGSVVHAAWRRQTDRLIAMAEHDPGRAGWLGRWLEADAAGEREPKAPSLLQLLLGLPGLPILITPPGASAGVGVGLAELLGDAAESDPRLAKVRALLAKAESTEFPAEAEAFTAKAQELMTAACIDEATLRASTSSRSTGRISAVRIGLDDPYIASKRTLLRVVCAANDARCVFHTAVDLATVVGPIVQLVHVELLFTSLLIQVQAALSADAERAAPGSHTRSRGYRSSFIVGFAMRIGERLHRARSVAFFRSGADALPVLAADDRATAELFDRLVGPTTRLRSSAGVDALGLRAGADAADRASLRESGLHATPTDTLGQLPDAS